jgi:hypothetical protein
MAEIYIMIRVLGVSNIKPDFSICQTSGVDNPLTRVPLRSTVEISFGYPYFEDFESQLLVSFD